MLNTINKAEESQKQAQEFPPDTQVETLQKNPDSITISTVQFKTALQTHQTMNISDISLVEPALEKIKASEWPIFEDVYDKYTAEKKWKKRKRPDKLERLKKNHVFLKIANKIMGGFTPLEKENGWVELATLWAFKEGGGIGTTMIQEAQKAYPKIFLFCRAENEANVQFFKNRGFQDLGINLDNVNIDEFIKNTPHSDDAHLFVWINE